MVLVIQIFIISLLTIATTTAFPFKILPIFDSLSKIKQHGRRHDSPYLSNSQSHHYPVQSENMYGRENLSPYQSSAMWKPRADHMEDEGFLNEPRQESWKMGVPTRRLIKNEPIYKGFLNEGENLSSDYKDAQTADDLWIRGNMPEVTHNNNRQADQTMGKVEHMSNINNRKPLYQTDDKQSQTTEITKTPERFDVDPRQVSSDIEDTRQYRDHSDISELPWISGMNSNLESEHRKPATVFLHDKRNSLEQSWMSGPPSADTENSSPNCPLNISHVEKEYQNYNENPHSELKKPKVQATIDNNYKQQQDSNQSWLGEFKHAPNFEDKKSGHIDNVREKVDLRNDNKQESKAAWMTGMNQNPGLSRGRDLFSRKDKAPVDYKEEQKNVNDEPVHTSDYHQLQEINKPVIENEEGLRNKSDLPSHVSCDPCLGNINRVIESTFDEENSNKNKTNYKDETLTSGSLRGTSQPSFIGSQDQEVLKGQVSESPNLSSWITGAHVYSNIDVEEHKPLYQEIQSNNNQGTSREMVAENKLQMPEKENIDRNSRDLEKYNNGYPIVEEVLKDNRYGENNNVSLEKNKPVSERSLQENIKDDFDMIVFPKEEILSPNNASNNETRVTSKEIKKDPDLKDNNKMVNNKPASKNEVSKDIDQVFAESNNKPNISSRFGKGTYILQPSPSNYVDVPIPISTSNLICLPTKNTNTQYTSLNQDSLSTDGVILTNPSSQQYVILSQNTETGQITLPQTQTANQQGILQLFVPQNNGLSTVQYVTLPQLQLGNNVYTLQNLNSQENVQGNIIKLNLPNNDQSSYYLLSLPSNPNNAGKVYYVLNNPTNAQAPSSTNQLTNNGQYTLVPINTRN